MSKKKNAFAITLVTLVKLALLYAMIFGGIILEMKLRDGKMKNAYTLMYHAIVPAMLSIIVAARKEKRSDTFWLVVVLSFCAVILFLIIAGIFGKSPKSYYIIFTVLLYIYAVFSMMFGSNDIKNDTTGEVYKYGVKTAKTTWMFIVEIHLFAKYLFPDMAAFTPLNIIIVVAVSLLPINFGPMRGGIVRLADFIYRKIKQISSKCPSCQNKFDLPVYICPSCGEKHEALYPNEEGIFKVPCSCGNMLPTTFFNGRQKLRSECPFCGFSVRDGGMHVDIPIPVIGGASSGKTCFIHTAIMQLQKNNYGLDFIYKKSKAFDDDHEEVVRGMEQGFLPQKTSDYRMRYYQFYLSPNNARVKNLVSLCDVAGETYDSHDEIGGQIGFKNATSFLIVVDPLSVAKYREEVCVSADDYRASYKSMDEILSSLFITLENLNCSTIKTGKADVAVAFTKCDIPGLDEIIGKTAVRKYLQNHKINEYDAQNAVCEKFLTDYEEANFLNTLKLKFRSIQFFTCSALGHVENGEAFTPQGVEEPVLWLLDKASPSVNLESVWGKKI